MAENSNKIVTSKIRQQPLPAYSKLAEECKDLWDRDAQCRGSLLNHCQECAEYFLPRRSTVTSKKELGGKRMQRVFRSTGLRALTTWATGMMNGIFPANSVFHMNKLRGVQIEDTPNVAREWLENVASAQYEAVMESNASEALHNAFLDEGLFGTSCVFVGESDKPNQVLFFRNFSIESYTLTEDAEGVPNGCVVMDTYTTAQLVEKFGDAVPKSIRGGGNVEEMTKSHKVIFGVLPNPEYDSTKTMRRGKDVPNNRPYRYVYALYNGLDVLETGGYYEFPFVITRVNKSYDEKFGRSPAMDALAECKMHNKTAEYDIAATERLIRPSYIVDSTSIMGPVNPQPGAVISADFSKGGSVVQPFPTTDNPSWGERLEEKTKQSIDSIFMVDVFVTVSLESLGQPNITATQWTMAKNERLAQLGPNLRVNEREKIRPLMDRVFGILWRNGMIPDPPEEIAGMQFISQPTSPLFSAVENAFEVEALNRTIGYCAQVMQVKPDIWDNMDLDAGFNLIAAAGGTAARTTRSPEEVEKIRKDRAEQQAREQAMQMAMVQQQQAQAQA